MSGSRIARRVGWAVAICGVSAAAAAAGCRNACQQLCAEMADYAEECGHPVTDDDLDACLERQAAPSEEDRATCQEFGDPEVIRSQWECADLERYWSGGAG